MIGWNSKDSLSISSNCFSEELGSWKEDLGPVLGNRVATHQEVPQARKHSTHLRIGSSQAEVCTALGWRSEDGKAGHNSV